MKRKMWFWVIPAILLLVIITSLFVSRQRTPTGHIQSFKEASDFTLLNLDSKPFNFSSLKEKAVILNFWATWCHPCRAEIPHLKSLYRQYKSKGLEVIGIALDHVGTNVVKSFLEDFEINYPILIGNQQITKDYGGIRGIPTTFVIDRKGRIVGEFVGYRDKEVFESAIKELL